MTTTAPPHHHCTRALSSWWPGHEAESEPRPDPPDLKREETLLVPLRLTITDAHPCGVRFLPWVRNMAWCRFMFTIESLLPPSASSKLLWVSASPVNHTQTVESMTRFLTAYWHTSAAHIHNTELIKQTSHGLLTLPVSRLCLFFMWTFLLPLWENVFPQMEHTCGFSPVSNIMITCYRVHYFIKWNSRHNFFTRQKSDLFPHEIGKTKNNQWNCLFTVIQ